MVADALTGVADRLVLISADTDLVPPIKLIANLAPRCEVFVAAPPKRFGLCRALQPRLEITAGRIRASRLDPQVQTGEGTSIACPADWLTAEELAASA